MDLVALLPWWLGIALAIMSYWILHGIAMRPLPSTHAGQPMADMITAAIWQGLTSVGQYALPLICLVGAVMSAARRWQRRRLFERASVGDSAGVLQDMSWQEFELLVGEGFRRRGYSVRETGGGGADGGVDLVLTKGGEKFFVQCKQWKAFKVGVSTVRELYGVMAAHGASGGFLVTSGRFTQEAVAFARGRNVRLVDGPKLMQLLHDARDKDEASPASSDLAASYDAARVQNAVESVDTTRGVEPAVATEPPDCPRCGKPMVRRVARRGPTAGKAFWGCSDFSAGCRGTREIGWRA